MFDNLLFFPFLDGILRDKVSICPCMFDVVVMRALVKWDVFEFIGRRRTKNWMVLCELYQ